MSTYIPTSEGENRSWGGGWNHGKASELNGWEGLSWRALLACLFFGGEHFIIGQNL